MNMQSSARERGRLAGWDPEGREGTARSCLCQAEGSVLDGGGSICSGDGGSITEGGGSVGYGESLGSILVGGCGMAYQEHAGTAPEEQGGLEGHLAGDSQKVLGVANLRQYYRSGQYRKGNEQPLCQQG